jgi:hypothetical protein
VASAGRGLRAGHEAVDRAAGGAGVGVQHGAGLKATLRQCGLHFLRVGVDRRQVERLGVLAVADHQRQAAGVGQGRLGSPGRPAAPPAWRPGRPAPGGGAPG